MKIVQIPKSILRKKAQLVNFPLSNKVIRNINEMIKYVDDSQKKGFEDRAGVGIAAAQIGIPLQMFYVNIPLENGKSYREFLINPKLIGESNAQSALSEGEGCLSVPNSYSKSKGYVIRKFKVVMEGYSYFKKKNVELSKVGYEAIVLQHEYDHIQGILFIDKINKKEPFKKPNELILI